jgi:hypothetical protein
MSTKHHTTTIHKIGMLRESEVVLFDCNCHTYLDAVGRIVAAIACEKVASVLSSTGLTVSVV